ncbi:MAG: hypothetical protein PVI43_06480 [Candidatus Bathyarchaeota archaeon]|jgi:hypothetical protein
MTNGNQFGMYPQPQSFSGYPAGFGNTNFGNFGQEAGGGGGNQMSMATLQEILLAMQEENKRLRKDNFKLAEKIRKIESGNFDEYYIYATQPIMLAAGGTATTTISVTREADFYLTKLVRVATAPFAFLIRDSSNDRQWSNIAVHSDIGAGTAQLPLILPKPRFIARASTITVELTDLSLAANEVRLGLIGYKVYHVEDLKTTVG